ATGAPAPPAPTCDTRSLERVAGEERVATAVAGARHGWDASSQVVLASAVDYPDALAAGVLAARRDAPVLLTLPDRLPSPVGDEIERLKAAHVVIVGGRAAVSEDVALAVAATAHRPQVLRIAGPHRYATAAEVARAAGPSATGEAVVVSGARFADAVSAGALAAVPDRLPPLLTTADRLHPDAEAALRDLDATEVIVVGGSAAVAPQVDEDLRRGGWRVSRLAGDDRYATSATVAARAADRLGERRRGAVLATGAAFPDALAAGGLAARTSSVLALVPPRDLSAAPAVADLLRTHAGTLVSSAVLGGRAAVSVRTAEQVADLLGAEPPDGPPVLVGAGDIAVCGSDGDEATAALLDRFGGTVATFGDNAYDRGTPGEFADCYHPSWGRHRDRTRPSPGNHDYGTDGAAGYFGYFGARAGDPGQGWYSYDLGPWWHVVALNSNCSAVAGCGPGSPQERWLRADLAANPDRHVVAYWHHPRWSTGRHGSSDATAVFWQALYDHGAELVLNGHDHTYERFAPMRPDGTADPTHGIRQFVVGTGGAGLYRFSSDPLPTTEVRRNDTRGVLVLTLRSEGYDWEFVPVAGGSFTDRGSTRAHGAP
ncbi:MAG TPA: cell wall-binding repeat-containing protein, partial [Nitriliruptorales bacterium]|nr:cell wall-binding repeat-containing protein [Nitriliruptorales bacterium]